MHRRRGPRRLASSLTGSPMLRDACSPNWSLLLPIVLVELSVLALLFPTESPAARDRSSVRDTPARGVVRPAYACRSRQLLHRVLMERAHGDAASLRQRVRALGCRALQPGERVRPAERRGPFVRVAAGRRDERLWTLTTAVP